MLDVKSVSTPPTPPTMRALVHPAYGSADVLRLEDVATPAVGDDDVLVRVLAASVCQGDIHILTGTPYLIRLAGYGVSRPRHPILGQDAAGRVEAVGKNVTSLRPGDEVFGLMRPGAFAEYVSAPAALFAPKPRSLTFAQAAAVPGSGITALQGLRDVGRLQPGQKVLINGASGGVGTFAVQIAKAMGAEVTAVCSTRHVDRVRSLGADHVVDYTAEDFAGGGPGTSSRRHDVMLDLVGNRALADCKRVLGDAGIYISCAGGAGGDDWLGPVVWMLRVVMAGALGRQTMTPFITRPNREDLLALTELIEAGKVTPVIERQVPLHDAVAAVRHVAEGHAQGKTVITM